MDKLREKLLSTLKDLSKEDFKEFKWHLENNTSIHRADLQGADRSDTVGLLMGLNPQKALDYAMDALVKIQRNDLVQKLSEVQVQVQGEAAADDQSLPKSSKPAKVCAF